MEESNTDSEMVTEGSEGNIKSKESMVKSDFNWYVYELDGDSK